MLSTSQLAPKASGKPFGFGNGWESFGNTHPKGGHLKKWRIPQVLPIYLYIFGFGATYIGRIRT